MAFQRVMNFVLRSFLVNTQNIKASDISMPFVLDKQWILSIRFDRLIAYKPTEVTKFPFQL